ncbi:MAG TPA: 2-phospho-L-lactate guanylyltransferase [Propionibacteriaceae bacterium]|nr:2-phospho-L-lactate guanylyltransferase [Propionibacteriaceae bacterium]
MDTPTSPAPAEVSNRYRAAASQAAPAPPFGAVIALKPTVHAKSRLATLPDPLRRRLAWTMAVDTLRVVGQVAGHVVVVSDQPGLATALRAHGLCHEVVPEPGRSGLNAALSHGASLLRKSGWSSVFACVGDLPALRPESTQSVLAAGSRFQRSFLADASGIGTTMLLSTRDDLGPHFQGRSAAAHRATGAVALTDELIGHSVADARRDVDSEVDLGDALRLGLGPLTAALFDLDSQSLGRYSTITVGQLTGHDHVAVTSEGYKILLPHTALDPLFRKVSTGQRLHAVVAADRALSAWL